MGHELGRSRKRGNQKTSGFLVIRCIYNHIEVMALTISKFITKVKAKLITVIALRFFSFSTFKQNTVL